VTDVDRTELSFDLAEQLLKIVGEYNLDVGGTALTITLAAVVAGYPASARAGALAQFIELLTQRLEQLIEAGATDVVSTH
jgi:hypothetical protein